jgi:hypothetical protein
MFLVLVLFIVADIFCIFLRVKIVCVLEGVHRFASAAEDGSLHANQSGSAEVWKASNHPRISSGLARRIY